VAQVRNQEDVQPSLVSDRPIECLLGNDKQSYQDSYKGPDSGVQAGFRSIRSIGETMESLHVVVWYETWLCTLTAVGSSRQPAVQLTLHHARRIALELSYLTKLLTVTAGMPSLQPPSQLLYGGKLYEILHENDTRTSSTAYQRFQSPPPPFARLTIIF